VDTCSEGKFQVCLCVSLDPHARSRSHHQNYFTIHHRICWFSIPFSLATSLGLASTALMLPITSSEAGSGLVPPAVAFELLGDTGAFLILIMLFMAIVSTGSAESIAVSSLIAYDIYRQYINPEATGEQILFVSRMVIVFFGLFMGAFSIVLFEIGLNLGWVYLFMGVIIGSAVIPVWNMMTWKKASGTGAIIAAWSGLFLAITGWLSAAKVQGGSITIDTLGTNEVMLSGNLIALLSSGFIHYMYSTFIDPNDFDFAELEKNITLVEQDMRGLTAEEQDPVQLAAAERWIKRRGYVLTVILIFIWPILSVPAGVFTRSYFAFWVLVAIAWGFGAAIVITVLPLAESAEDIETVLSGMFNACCGRKADHHLGNPDAAAKEVSEEDEDDVVKAEPFDGVEAVEEDEA
jgi:Na+/proline symporter